MDGWLDEHTAELAPDFEGIGTLDQQMAQLRKVMRLTYDAGFMSMGWPERVGGLGGSNLLRAYLAEAVTSRDLVEAGLYSMPEVLAPTMIDFAPEELAAEMVPLLLRGDEVWCQGFSEPGTGSNLASLICRAKRTDEGWRINGQKVWTSLAQFASRCVLLTRTGTVESAHRGITALFVDMDTPGITVRPIETMHGSPEFCEVFYDDVLVPHDRLLGEVDRGWSIAMDLLPYERSTALWQRAAYLQRRLEQLVEAAPAGALDPSAVGEVTQLVLAFRARSRRHAAAAGGGRDPGGGDLHRQGAPGHGGTSAVRRRGRRARSGGDTRRRPGERAVARRVPLLTCGIDLWRQCRNSAQHHRPPAAGPRRRCVMDAAERELFEGAIRRATESSTGEALDAALEDLGWSDALEDDPHAAVSLFFEAQGRAGVTSSALDRLLAHVLGMTGERVAVVLPPLRQSAAPARLEGDRCAVAGLSTAAFSTASVVVAVAPSGEGDAAFVLRTDALEGRPTIGLDPTLGLFEVSGIVDVAAGGGVPTDWHAAAVLGQLADEP